MKYNVDLSKLTVAAYQNLLKNQNLLPGRRVLWQNIDRNFDLIQSHGVKTVEQLKKALSTPAKMARFAADTGIAEDYLTILRREVNSFEQTPVPLGAFPGIDPALVERLQANGLRNSKEYFEAGNSAADELYCLCDLVRVNGIGAVAARTFYEAGYRSATDIAKGDASEMLQKITAVNAAKHYYQAKLGLSDMQFCIDFAALLTTFGG